MQRRGGMEERSRVVCPITSVEGLRKTGPVTVLGRRGFVMNPIRNTPFFVAFVQYTIILNVYGVQLLFYQTCTYDIWFNVKIYSASAQTKVALCRQKGLYLWMRLII